MLKENPPIGGGGAMRNTAPKDAAVPLDVSEHKYVNIDHLNPALSTSAKTVMVFGKS